METSTSDHRGTFQPLGDTVSIADRRRRQLSLRFKGICGPTDLSFRATGYAETIPGDTITFYFRVADNLGVNDEVRVSG